MLALVEHALEPDAGTITYRNNITVGSLGQADHLRDDDQVCHAVVGDTPEYVWASDPTVRGIIAGEVVTISWAPLSAASVIAARIAASSLQLKNGFVMTLPSN